MAMSKICASLVVTGSLAAVTSRALAQDEIAEFTEGDQDDRFGVSCTGIGDVDGDGVPDLLVGAMYANAPNRAKGRAYVLSGASFAVVHTIDGTQNGGLTGFRVLGLPDVDGDGIGDFVVSSPYVDTAGGGAHAGRISVYSGDTGLLIRDHDGGSSSGQLGISLAAIRDIDGDGVGDYLAGANTGQGEVFAWSGASGALLFTLSKGLGGQEFGFTLATIGDVDADGMDDVAVGTLSGGNGCGVVDVFSGATQANLVTLVGNPPDDAGIGKALAGAGDLDGDGVPDLVVGDPDHRVSGIPVGSVTVYSGATWSPITTWYGRDGSDGFGVNASCVGDVNGDGVADVLVGSSKGSLHHGAAYLFSGRTFERLFRLVCDTPATLFGLTVGAAGDLTGDGLADVLVGAIDDSTNGFHSGRVFAFAGNDVFLDSNGRAFFANDQVRLAWNCTNAAQLAALVVVEVAAVPCFTIIDLGTTDALGKRAYSATVPAGLTGIDVSLQSFSLDPVRGPIDSAVVMLSFL